MKNSSLEKSTKKEILAVATRLFSNKGYDHTSISDIAKEVGLSDGALYNYFKGKEDLLLSIPDYWLKDAQRDILDQLFGIEGSFNKLRKFMWWILRYVENNPDTAKVTFLFLKTSRPFMDTEVYQNLKNVYSVLLDIFKEGKESGEMKPDFDPYIARQIFLGTIEHIIVRWLLKDMSYSLFDTLEQTFVLIRDGFKLTDPEKHRNT